ncbi:hypothetical protein CYMTET_26179 [Cymbomonas tetramitiformis]|uniref:Sidoreflexin n=1 Tax=Cymbomonas tetramitiformis TaxID=36881 RepID=A0AAE0FSV1_9CHLO|nr:hypothetical protein CYMTET_26179 [Cymbomonas tetramitiformis]|eukprot:gene16697-19836_t
MGPWNYWPTFDPNGNRYDQNTYFGRYCHFVNLVNPMRLLATDTDLNQAKTLLDGHSKGLKTAATDQQLWEAKELLDMTLHPDTKEKVPAPFRMSAFALVNVPICVGLMTPNPTIAATLFWQWINQSYNVAVNFANRNASNTMKNEEIMRAYGIATATSCSIAVGLGQFVKRSGFLSPGVRNLVQRVVPYTAIAVSSSLNICLMRADEAVNGIDVRNAAGEVIGRSTVAGKEALFQTVFSRAFLVPVAPLLLPPLIMSRLNIRNPRLRFAAELMVINGCIFSALPACIAAFPQVSAIKRTELEPALQAKTTEELLYFNKGL